MILRDNLMSWKKYRKVLSFPIEEEVTDIDKDGNESVVALSYKTNFLKFSDFMIKSCW